MIIYSYCVDGQNFKIFEFNYRATWLATSFQLADDTERECNN